MAVSKIERRNRIKKVSELKFLVLPKDRGYLYSGAIKIFMLS